jgi:hypothetical protein
VEIEEIKAVETPKVEIEEIKAVETPKVEIEEIKAVETPKVEIEEIKAVETPKVEIEEIKAVETPKVEIEEIKAVETPKVEIEEIKAVETPKVEIEYNSTLAIASAVALAGIGIAGAVAMAKTNETVESESQLIPIQPIKIVRHEFIKDEVNVKSELKPEVVQIKPKIQSKDRFELDKEADSLDKISEISIGRAVGQIIQEPIIEEPEIIDDVKIIDNNKAVEIPTSSQSQETKETSQNAQIDTNKSINIDAKNIDKNDIENILNLLKQLDSTGFKKVLSGMEISINIKFN